MSQEPRLDDDQIAAMIVDDVVDLIGRGQATQRALLEQESKWLQAGASPDTCKVVRLLASTLGSILKGQAAGRDEAIATILKAIQLSRETFATGENTLPSRVLTATADTVAVGSRPLALVMKGGGIKGLAYVGAIELLAERYSFNWFVGTSAGAISAVLLGAGYTADELKEILKGKNFRDFFDARGLKKLINLGLFHGIHPADSFTEWIDVLLAQKLGKVSRVRLSDLPHRVTVYASRRDKTALKFDPIDNDADAAYAVRCSMSIPFVFIPQSDQGIRTFDGGLQHNYPVKELLSHHPDLSFISLYLGPEVYEPVRQRWVIGDLLSIWTESGDHAAIEEYRDRTVIIDPRPIGTLQFDLTGEEKEYLLVCGRVGAMAHLSGKGGEYAEVRIDRDRLKSAIGQARRIAHTKRRAKRIFCYAMLLVSAAFIVWYFCLRVMPRPSGEQGGVPASPSAVPRRASSG